MRNRRAIFDKGSHNRDVMSMDSGFERRHVCSANRPHVGPHGEVDVSACLKTGLYGDWTSRSDSDEDRGCPNCSFVDISDMLEDLLNSCRVTLGVHSSKCVMFNQVRATTIEAEDSLEGL